MTPELLVVLIVLQIAMGAFDTLYHHEMTERLAWHATAEKELRLHAVRNWLYAGLFLLAAWGEPHGALAAIVLAVLAVELLITLWDFVEEDLSRRLPGTERVTHTLLAVNYGGILTFIGPMLWAWMSEPTGLDLVSRGLLSGLLTLAALAVAIFGLRDWLAAARAPRLVHTAAAPLVAALGPERRRVLVTGATGFIGTRLVAALVEGGHDVVALVRSRDKAAGLAAPVTLVTRLEQIPGDALVDAIVNLAGSPVADAPWTRANRHRILRSRLKVARAIERLVARLERKPKVLVTASAIGFYGEGGDDPLTEADRPSGARKLGFAHRSCAAVETAAARIRAQGVRVIALRIGLVLDHSGGMLARMLPAFDLGLGGRIGSGRQWMSWVHRDDVVRLVAHGIARDDIEGALNATAPAPARNRDFTAALGRALGRPALLFIPAWPLRTLLGDMGNEILLASQRVMPAKALGTGFKFLYPCLESALAAAVGQRHGARPTSAAKPAEGRAALASPAE
ncbi:MAG: TIGR01777 family oxidoreductase [Hyphomicrobiaceae bacterium]